MHSLSECCGISRELNHWFCIMILSDLEKVVQSVVASLKEAEEVVQSAIATVASKEGLTDAAKAALTDKLEAKAQDIEEKIKGV